VTPDITLYFCKRTRAFVPRWLLEEIGIPYRTATVRLDRGEHKTAQFRQVNSMGKVPALTDGDGVVSETPAICLLLADRYAPGTLAPAIEDEDRGAYLRWMVFATAVFEPAIYLDEPQDEASASGRGWGRRADVLAAIETALAAGPYLLGQRFTAADVMLGGLLSIALFNHRIADPPASLIAYDRRLSARPAYRRAAQATWG